MKLSKVIKLPIKYHNSLNKRKTILFINLNLYLHFNMYAYLFVSRR